MINIMVCYIGVEEILTVLKMMENDVRHAGTELKPRNFHNKKKFDFPVFFT